MRIAMRTASPNLEFRLFPLVFLPKLLYLKMDGGNVKEKKKNQKNFRY